MSLPVKDYSKLTEKAWRKKDPPMLPPRDTRIQQDLMEEAHKLLDGIGLRHWLVDGALILLVRDKELKPYNQDIDFACYAEDIQPLMRQLKGICLLCGYAVRAFKENTRLDMWKSGEMVSVQGYVKKGKFRYLKNKRIPERYFENSETVTHNGLIYVTPSIDKYLTWKYSNWHVPYTGDTKNKGYLNKKNLVGKK